MTLTTRTKFGKILSEFKTNKNISPIFQKACKGLKELKQKRIENTIKLCK